MEQDSGLEDLECCNLLSVRGFEDEVTFWEGFEGRGWCCFTVIVMVREGGLRERGNRQGEGSVNNLKGSPNVMLWDGFFFTCCWGSAHGHFWDG